MSFSIHLFNGDVDDHQLHDQVKEVSPIGYPIENEENTYARPIESNNVSTTNDSKDVNEIVSYDFIRDYLHGEYADTITIRELGITWDVNISFNFDQTKGFAQVLTLLGLHVISCVLTVS